MRHLKALGLAAMTITAVLVFVGSASATVLTSPAGTKVPAETAIKIESESIQWDGPNLPNCPKLNFEGKITNAGGPEETVSGPVQQVKFWGCSTDTLTFIKTGNFELHDAGSGNGTLTWTGAEMTVLFHKSIGGFPVTTHCLYKTENTSVGTVTGSSTTKGTAQVDISSTFVGISTDGSCGTLRFTGNAKVSAPDYLDIDKEIPVTTLTSPKGTKAEVGTEIKAESEGAIEFAGTTTFNCQKSTVEGKISHPGGEAVAKAELTKWTFGECGNHTVTVLKPGTLEIHGTSGRNGTLTSTGAEITLLTHGAFLGTRHCIYTTNKTDIGTITGSSDLSPSTATLDIGPTATPQTTTDASCGTDAKWAGSYKVTSPDYLAIDDPTDPPHTETTLTSPPGATVEAGAMIKAESEAPFEFVGGTSVSCQKSALEAKVTSPGGGGATVKAELTGWSFAECGADTVEVKNPGTLEVHSTFFGLVGWVESSGAEITVLTHGAFGTQHCIYMTSKTRIGWLKESSASEGDTATMNVEVEMPTSPTDGACGEEVLWKSSYKVTSPDYLDID